MRGESERQATLMLGLSADGFVPQDHPLRRIKSGLLMAFYTIRSKRQFCEQLRYNILFKWFLDLIVEDEPFHPTTFTKNRERLPIRRAPFFGEHYDEVVRNELQLDEAELTKLIFDGVIR